MMYLLHQFNVLSCLFKTRSLNCGFRGHPTYNLGQEENQHFLHVSCVPEFSIGVSRKHHCLVKQDNYCCFADEETADRSISLCEFRQFVSFKEFYQILSFIKFVGIEQSIVLFLYYFLMFVGLTVIEYSWDQQGLNWRFLSSLCFFVSLARSLSILLIKKNQLWVSLIFFLMFSCFQFY